MRWWGLRPAARVKQSLAPLPQHQLRLQSCTVTGPHAAAAACHSIVCAYGQQLLPVCAQTLARIGSITMNSSQRQLKRVRPLVSTTPLLFLHPEPTHHRAAAAAAAAALDIRGPPGHATTPPSPMQQPIINSPNISCCPSPLPPAPCLTSACALLLLHSANDVKWHPVKQHHPPNMHTNTYPTPTNPICPCLSSCTTQDLQHALCCCCSPPACTCVEEGHQLIGLHVQQLVQVHATERELAVGHNKEQQGRSRQRAQVGQNHSSSV